MTLSENEETGALSLLETLLDQNGNNTEEEILSDWYVEQHYSTAEESTISTPGKIRGNNASLKSSIVTLTNTVVGAGMLGLPGAFSGCGYVTGSILLVLASILSANGLKLLTLSAETVGIHPPQKLSSFYTVANASIPKYTVLIDVAVAVKCFGVATSYLITFCDCMVDTFHYFDFGSPILLSRQFWVSIALMLVLPISFFQTLDALKFTSTLSLILILSLAIGIVLFANDVEDPCEGFHDDHFDEVISNITGASNDNCSGETTNFEPFTSTVRSMSIFVFSFTCQQNIFAVLNELRKRTNSRVNKMIQTSIGSSLILYIVVAFAGYKTYGSNVESDILLNYPATGLVTIMRIAIATMMIFSYPLQLDPSRRCIITLIVSMNSIKDRFKSGSVQATMCSTDSESGVLTGDTETSKDRSVLPVTEINCSLQQTPFVTQNVDNKFDGSQCQGQPITVKTFFIVTCMFLVLSYTIAMIVDDLGIVLAVVGATGSTTIAYIIPGAIYINLHDKFDAMKIVAWMQLLLGCIIMPCALYFILFDR